MLSNITKPTADGSYTLRDLTTLYDAAGVLMYRITTVTSSAKGAGTDANVSIVIIGISWPWMCPPSLLLSGNFSIRLVLLSSSREKRDVDGFWGLLPQ